MLLLACEARTHALLQISEGDDLRSQGRETMKAYSPMHTIEHTRLQVRESRAMADVGSDMRGSHHLSGLVRRIKRRLNFRDSA